MKGVIRVLRLLSQLGCMKFEVGVDWEDLGFLVEVSTIGQWCPWYILLLF